MSYNVRQNKLNIRTFVALLLLGLVWPAVQASLAQTPGTTAITPTSGPGNLGTTVTLHGNTVQITGGTRASNGPSLFHSFDQFTVGTGNTAQFLNTTPSLLTSNILGRVTGGNPSSIFGTIDTMSYPGANFFLMNPAGIVFGPDATLTVGGSVAFTTANYLRHAETTGANSGIFHADTTATSHLTSAPVVAFGFLNSNPGTIAVLGSTLTVQTGQGISLIGGDITVESSKFPNNTDFPLPNPPTPGKQVYIASVASPGEVLAKTLVPTANINGLSLETLGTVTISNKSNIDTSGHDGSIRIRGGRLVIDDSTIFTHTGDILLDATSVHITNEALIATETLTADHAGPITIKSLGDIDIDSSADVGSFSTEALGRAGEVTLISQRNITLVGKANVFQDTSGSGDTGKIVIYAPNGDISLTDSGIFNTINGTGTLGGIQIQARNLLLSENSKIGGDNRATTQAPGNITITLDSRLDLTSGSFINTGALGLANSSDIVIKSPTLLITGKDSGLYTRTFSSGDGGHLRLFTDSLKLMNGGRLSSESIIDDRKIIPSGHGGEVSIEGYHYPGTSVMIDGPGSGIFTNAEGTGTAGDISVKASSVTLQNGGTLSAETTGISLTATGGSIILTATDQVTLTNGGSISASSTGSGAAGNIEINAGKQFDVERGSITTQANQLNGGNITIQASDLVRVVNGRISTSALTGGGNGGNITIDPKVVLLQNSNVLAQANRGTGGDISITTPVFIMDQSSSVDASTPFGLNGQITIQSPTSNLSGAVGQLVSKTSPPQVLLQNRCVALAGGEQSTFLLAGRDALPGEPSGWLSSPISTEHWTREDTAHVSRLMVQNREVTTSPTAVSRTSTSAKLSLRRLTPPGFLVRTFATGATGCPS